MNDESRGKRRLAQRVVAAWGLFSAACLAAIGFGDLANHEIDGLVALHWAVTVTSGGLAFGLLGLDSAAAQIIPAMKREQK